MADARWRTGIGWLLGAVFLATGLGKALDIGGFALVLGEFRLLPAAALLPLAGGITVIELLIGAGLLLPGSRRPAAAGAALLAAGNALLLVLTLARGIRLDNCGCFGVFLSRPLTVWSPVEDVALLALAGFLLLPGQPRGRARAALAAVVLSALAAPATAQDFPPAQQAAGHALVLNGVGTRTWSPLRVPVYRAALYLEAPSTDPAAVLASPGVKLVRVHYLRGVGLDDVVAAWEASFRTLCACDMPPAFRGWLRGLRAGDEESYLFTPAGVELDGPGRPAARLAGPAASNILLAAWIGPEVPSEALRRGLLGQR